MTAFPVVTFDASPWSCRIVLVIATHVSDRCHLRAIVAGYDHHRAVSNA